MGKTRRPSIVARLDQDKLDRLDELAQQTRTPRSVLIREAIDDLLMKYKLRAHRCMNAVFEARAIIQIVCTALGEEALDYVHALTAATRALDVAANTLDSVVFFHPTPRSPEEAAHG